MIDKFVSYLESSTSVALVQGGVASYEDEDYEWREYLDKIGAKFTNFELAKQNAINLLETEIKRLQHNLDFMKTITLENWDKQSWTEEERGKFFETTKQ